MKPLTLGYSPCPNDTFIFCSIASGLIDPHGLQFDIRLQDVERLNRMAIEGKLDVTKISIAALPFCQDRYQLLPCGGAMGRGCGPLVVARPGLALEDVRQARVAVPGRMTTAHLLFSLFLGTKPDVEPLPFEQIMPAVVRGDFDCGVIIHEGRFTFHHYGLVELLDLGRWWEEETGLPIPLGGIVLRRGLDHLSRQIRSVIRESVVFAMDHPEATRTYVRQHAQEMEEAVTREHIRLYVNSYTLDLGNEGQAAVNRLLGLGASSGLLPKPLDDLFVS
jgi:1,4-dihydroxy-6-naphthoate synthase